MALKEPIPCCPWCGGEIYWWKLSFREREVLRLIAKGKNNREIKDLLFISQNTIEDHITKIGRKLGLPGSRVKLAQFAMVSGLWPLREIINQFKEATYALVHGLPEG